MPHKDTSNMTPPGAAETRGLQEVDVLDGKEEQVPTERREVKRRTAK